MVKYRKRKKYLVHYENEIFQDRYVKHLKRKSIAAPRLVNLELIVNVPKINASWQNLALMTLDSLNLFKKESKMIYA